MPFNSPSFFILLFLLLPHCSSCSCKTLLIDAPNGILVFGKRAETSFKTVYEHICWSARADDCDHHHHFARALILDLNFACNYYMDRTIYLIKCDHRRSQFAIFVLSIFESLFNLGDSLNVFTLY